MSGVAVDAINASSCVSSLFHPGSWGDSALLIVFLLTSGIRFHLPLPSVLRSLNLSILSSPSTSLSHCRFVFELSQPVNLLPAPVDPCRLFDKALSSSNEQRPAARQQWSLCVDLITVSLLRPGPETPKNACVPCVWALRHDAVHQNTSSESCQTRACQLCILDCQQVRPVLKQGWIFIGKWRFEPAST